jgi:hypothetical protein
MAKQKRKLIEKLLFEVYDKGLQMQGCNLTDYYEKILQALNIPLVVRRSKLLSCPHCKGKNVTKWSDNELTCYDCKRHWAN